MKWACLNRNPRRSEVCPSTWNSEAIPVLAWPQLWPKYLQPQTSWFFSSPSPQPCLFPSLPSPCSQSWCAWGGGVCYHALLQGSSWPRDWPWVSCLVGRFFLLWATREAPVAGSRVITMIVSGNKKGQRTGLTLLQEGGGSCVLCKGIKYPQKSSLTSLFVPIAEFFFT